MFTKLWEIVLEFRSVLGEMSPYLLFGFLVAGILSVLIRAETVERHLGGNGLWPVVKASAFGVPLPLCSCGVIPVAASLRKHGASRGATTSFLISTPQTQLARTGGSDLQAVSGACERYHWRLSSVGFKQEQGAGEEIC